MYGFLIAALSALVAAESSFTPLRPPALPLAVKSPYMSTWQQAGADGGNGGYLAGQWPVFWNGEITGFTGYVRIDNVTYIWMGDPIVGSDENYYAYQTAYTYTASQSIFSFNVAGLVGMNVTFTSPILPDTILEMSLPYSYMNVDVWTIDGKTHNVQIYSDISAEWVAGDRTATAQWSYGNTPGKAQPSAVQAPHSAVSPQGQGEPTVYATATEFHVLPASPINTGISPTFASGQGVYHPGSTTVPEHVQKHESDKTPKKNPHPGGIAYHEVFRQQQLVFAEYNQQAEWGDWYFATANVTSLTYQSAQDIIARGQFINNGFLTDTVDPNFRAINDDYPVFAFAKNLGSLTSTPQSTLFQLSLHQQDCILYEAPPPQGNISVPCMWTNYFNSSTNALGYFYNQYNTIQAEANAFDASIKSRSLAAVPAAGGNYYALTALATRQAFGALEYTNTPANPWVFLKEISSDGNIQTVDVIFPFHPIAIATNASILKYMLEPLLLNQEAGYFPFQYSIHNLGNFPNATGFNNPGAALAAEEQPVEESGDMVIMALAYAQRANDNAWLADNYNILKQWTNYLVNNTLYPGYQLSTDDFLGPVVNDTNLAIKGIIAIEAMAQIANRTGHVQDGKNFTRIAHNYVNKWYNLGFLYNVTPQHEISGYNLGNANWSMLYNLYGDRECGLQLVKEEIYNIQSNFYETVKSPYGVALRNTLDNAKTDWEIWTASIANNNTQNMFIDTVADWLNVTQTSLPFTDEYNVNTGDYGIVTFIARPVVGGMFSLLALESAPTSPYVNP